MLAQLREQGAPAVMGLQVAQRDVRRVQTIRQMGETWREKGKQTHTPMKTYLQLSIVAHDQSWGWPCAPFCSSTLTLSLLHGVKEVATGHT